MTALSAYSLTSWPNHRCSKSVLLCAIFLSFRLDCCICCRCWSGKQSWRSTCKILLHQSRECIFLLSLTVSDSADVILVYTRQARFNRNGRTQPNQCNDFTRNHHKKFKKIQALIRIQLLMIFACSSLARSHEIAVGNRL